MPAACDYLNFIWIVIFLCCFFQPRDNYLWIEQNQLAIIFLAHLPFKIVCFHSLKINVKSSTHTQLFPKYVCVCVCVKLFFRLYTENIFTDCGINTQYEQNLWSS